MKSIMDIQDIMKILPHRYPFLLVDGVTKIEHGKYAEGFKNFTLNEWFFQGHIPGNPIVPGVLIVEALAQLTAIMFYPEAKEDAQPSDSVQAENNKKMGYLGKIKEMQFKRPVKPGERLRLVTHAKESYGNVCMVQAEAYSEEDLCVAKGIIVITQ